MQPLKKAYMKVKKSLPKSSSSKAMDKFVKKQKEQKAKEKDYNDFVKNRNKKK